MPTFGREDELERINREWNLDYFGEEPPEEEKEDGFGGFIQRIVDYWGEDNFLKSTWRAVFGEAGQESGVPSITGTPGGGGQVFRRERRERPFPAPGVRPMPEDGILRTPSGERYTLPRNLGPENTRELRDIMENR